MKRSGKFYYKNEKETLKKLGLTPAPQSGAGWVVKEDGENETTMVQLKSTDSNSYTLGMLDMKKLEYHASVSNKVPVFLVQFLQQDKLYAIVNISDLPDLLKAFESNEAPSTKVQIKDEVHEVKTTKVKSSKKAREQFFVERSKNYGKRG